MNNKASWWVIGFDDNHASDVGNIGCGMSCVDNCEKEINHGYVGVLGDGLAELVDYGLFVSQVGPFSFEITIGNIG